MRSRPQGLLVGSLIGALGVLALLTPLGWSLEENIGLTALFHLRGPIAAPSEVVVVAIDQPSADALALPAKPSDWPRSVHAKLIDNLVKANASVIAFDLTFGAPGRDPQHDRELAEAMRAANRVLVVQSLRHAQPHADAKEVAETDELIPPIPLIADAVRARTSFMLPKASRVNEYWVYKSGIKDADTLPTMPAVALQLYSEYAYEEFFHLMRGVSPAHAESLPENRAAMNANKRIPEFILDMRHLFAVEPQLGPQMMALLHSPVYQTLGEREIRGIDALLNLYIGDETHYLNFYGPPRTIRTIPYWEVVRAEQPLDLKGAAVFVGYSALTLAEQDQIRDDYHTVFSLPNGVYVSGVEIAATAFANLLHNRPIKPLPLWANLCVVFGWGVLLAIVCRTLPNLAAVAIAIILVLAYVAFAAHQFETNAVWLALAIPLGLQLPLAVLGGVYLKYRQSRRERQRLHEGASRYLPSRVINEILENVKPTAQHQLLFGVCLATDADQYTTLAEKMRHKELSELLNQYYAVLFAPVQRHGGIVSDVVGDSMFAVWAGTAPDLALRKHACEACLEITRALDEFNQAQDRSPLPTRLGLHCGEILLGSIGADQHFEYRAVGDTVNTASRVQGLNKYLNTRLILSAETAEGLEGYLMRPLGSFVLVGKSNPITVLELMGYSDNASEEQRWLCREFADALAAYETRKWSDACGAFQMILERFPQDGPAGFYHTLCGGYAKTPPDEPWRPVVQMAAK